MIRLLILWVVIGLNAAGSTWAQGGDAEAPAPTTAADRAAAAKLRQEIAMLRRVAAGRDVERSLEAINKMIELGEPARADVSRVLLGAINRSERLAQRALRGAGSHEKIAAFEAKLEDERKAAWENIKKLEKGEPVARAHKHYQALKKMYAELGPQYDRRAAAADALALRARYVKLFQGVADEEQQAKLKADTDRLNEQANAALGMSIDKAITTIAPGNTQAPTDTAARSLWHHAMCNRIDAYNARHIKAHMDRAEWENATVVNTYRRWLGALPYELDTRLIQAARRHSKDMATKGYFSHDAPDPKNRTHADRIKNAGYDRPYSENIAWGHGGGAATFWQWFDSPGHHKNMVNRSSIALGVGRWGNTWTQNMGKGKRLMGLTDEQRKAIKIEGKILRPGG
jgi:uncharacterized protein YkwD